ncbi:Cytosol aminopeptidase [Roseivivax sp. THAF40]|uniref:leucyl aminopeptidase family protein n=1 Tax=unclassified Roseivivax TaxID=2639302 RepID=UPI0012692CFA|nr:MULTISPECIES: leucyl aminopeptidase family protein [unclassified Roseivivax]QFS81336.1 Cytosol aminopeptidase [Roseivivax sp. THAF197b]QFT45065.1 Cytosol aminopeptidase [Roseivivax sp. THAF40]
MTLRFASATDGALDLHVLEQGQVAQWLEGQEPRVAAWVEASGFEGAIGEAVLIPGPDGAPVAALAGYGTPASRARSHFALAAAAPRFKGHVLRVADGLPADDAEREALGWLLSGYGFSRYRDQTPKIGELVAPDGIDAGRVEALAAAEALTRDLINTPAADMGPEALEAAVRDLARDHDAHVDVIAGQGLLEHNFPMIHAVGRAAKDDPRLIDMLWGSEGPRLTLVGKGVCFDTGGLNLKPGASMGLMKKDMGGAATVLGLAKAIMELDLKLQLRVLVPAVENSVAGDSFRPQDILTSRKGLTVEINNTDAEGRLVLADALALADETTPDLILSMATLTGAARVAVGPDIAPFFATDDRIAQALEAAAPGAADPVWRLPYHAPYETMIEPGIADLDNAPKGGFAGAITAALFLRRFVTDTPRYAHFDIYGWQPQAAPGRSKGGVGQGARAILAALPELLDL